MNSGIYKIENVVNGKIYVGSAINFSNRFIRHKTALKHDNHCNEHLQRTWNKYGKENFKFEIIENCIEEKLLFREQFWIDKLEVVKKGYNMCPTAGNCLGIKRSKEHKEKCSKAKMGKNNPMYGKKQSKETIEKRSIKLRGNTNGFKKGQHHSISTEFKKGHKVSIETIKKRTETRKKSGWNKRNRRL